MAEITRLQGNVARTAHGWDWQLQGSCRQASPETFFHPEGERGTKRRSRDEQARAICVGCPVIEACREHALSVREPFGVWGGLTEDERERIYAAHPPLAASIAG